MRIFTSRKKIWTLDWLKVSRFQFRGYKIENGNPVRLMNENKSGGTRLLVLRFMLPKMRCIFYLSGIF